MKYQGLVVDHIKDIRVEIISENDIEFPAVIFRTDNFDRSVDALRNFKITPLPINLDILKTLNTEESFPDKFLRLELSFEDIFPLNAYETYISSEQTDFLSYSNKSSKRLRFIIEGKNGIFGKTNTLVLHDLYPYVLDWKGILGLFMLKRLSMKNIDNVQINNFINSLELHIEENGYATGIFTELGYLNKMKNDLDRSVECYMLEIKNSFSDNGLGNGCSKAVNNLAVLYKQNNQIEKARDLFKLALNLNPNYFEANLSISGLLNDLNLSLKCIARAYKIRSDDPGIDNITEIISELHGYDPVELKSKITNLSEIIDISKPFDEFIIEDFNVFFTD